MMRLLLLVQIQILELENLNFLSWSWFSHYRVNVAPNEKYRNSVINSMFIVAAMSGTKSEAQQLACAFGDDTVEIVIN